MPTRAFIEAEWAKKGGTGLPPLAGRAEEKWTVLYKIEEGGNQTPLVGFSKVKIKKASDGSTLEKNKAWNAEAGIINAEVQKGYFVTIVAEGEEEAVKVVDAIVNGNVDPVTGSATQGPKLGSNVNGKYGACLSANLKEVAVIP